ncbi:MAG: DNA polymerase III subunit beta [Candidatus Brennerbacteria bacterium RIFOXYC1_FULL_41_11]|uniref:Beta sliding clamp n=1 Tax=Candidatus Brennerbacteria bacterium RIFOXYD1_FULL_41_16 TaxID=1797529 RepID=A0A1G1XLZ1_9BACT|nr:MAG: polymerase III subunit beta protein [Parcubacteria group bacterium GW2011_GWB1_41_4]OGY39571.1 MAG: DNA polymerase III subunit beta [Candidatus Brennerbacteria bacterium RIFOXYB1_FULL_41_13]OGY40122.1 MAG: DNA polymerase III subunit beta [Candidatus Brennerbacteria bacterium RIFOXYC1_FULL_41_11]OGY40686.1 MAG: DNA polymerase III subunit beta [Candidatus Brennerbacteria bacterium RIFOXYD1_FULL_41_16]
MRFTSLLENIKKSLLFAEKALGKSSNLPILSSFLIEAEKNTVKVSATNLEIGIKSSFSAKIEKEGKVVVPAKTLINFLGQVNEAKLDFVLGEKKLVLKTDEYQAEFSLLDAEEFPIIPEVKSGKTLRIESNLLAKSFEQVLIASSRNDFRPELSSVYFGFQEGIGLKIVATDTFRLAEKIIPDNEFHALVKEKTYCLIPLRTAEEVMKIAKEKLEPCDISIDQNQILFEWKETSLISRLLEGEFPDYDAVVPKDFESQLTASQEKLLEALRVTGVFSSKLNDVKLNFSPKDKKLILLAQDNFVGSNQAKVELESVKGESREMVFNYRYLLDGLQAMQVKEKVFIGFGSQERPILIRSENDASYFYILMPLRL